MSRGLSHMVGQSMGWSPLKGYRVERSGDFITMQDVYLLNDQMIGQRTSCSTPPWCDTNYHLIPLIAEEFDDEQENHGGCIQLDNIGGAHETIDEAQTMKLDGLLDGRQWWLRTSQPSGWTIGNHLESMMEYTRSSRRIFHSSELAPMLGLCKPVIGKSANILK